MGFARVTADHFSRAPSVVWRRSTVLACVIAVAAAGQFIVLHWLVAPALILPAMSLLSLGAALAASLVGRINGGGRGTWARDIAIAFVAIALIAGMLSDSNDAMRLLGVEPLPQ